MQAIKISFFDRLRSVVRSLEVFQDVMPVLSGIGLPQKSTILRTIHLARMAQLVNAIEFLESSEYLTLAFDGSRKGNEDFQGVGYSL